MVDVRGIARLARETLEVGRRVAGRRAQLHVSVSTFVPKPHTPFQWCAQDDRATLAVKQDELRAGFGRAINLAWHDPQVSLLEAALARGDRRMGAVILRARQMGARFDAWTEHFQPGLWRQAADEVGVDLAFFGRRQRSLDEVLPWQHVRSGASPDYLRRQYEAALAVAAAGETV